jgi:adenylate cyclase class 2
VAIGIEREIKLHFESAEAARAAVSKLDAAPLRGRRLQEDSLLDSPGQTLGTRGCVLRVRTEAGKSQLTFKGPVQPATMKVREELETVVGDGAVLQRVLEELGLRVWFRYQKYREEFSLEDVVLAIDETPVGTFIELEGGEDAIAAAAQALGRTPADFVLDSYRSLFARYCADRGLTLTDMLFDEP